MNILNRLSLRLRCLQRSDATQAPVRTALRADAGTDEPCSLCGWFDSSHELVRGLQVQELGTPESLAAALPLSSWLELQLAACSAPPRPA